ncbi:MAG: PAS domain S-box protein [Planctomycetes bacterium]|nr:PAS domain S-box protein [Planctomycetota bacterium]
MSVIVDAHRHDPGFGKTGELVMARHEGDQIVFLFHYRHGDGGDPEPVPWASRLAAPMRLALSGKEGTLIGLDYRGEPVLAAHRPVDVVGLGVVAKSDLTEIRAPFVIAALTAGGVTLLLVLVGVAALLRIIDPLVRKLEESKTRFRTISSSVQDAIIMMDGEARVSYWNETAQSLFGYTEGQAIGQYVHAFLPAERYRERHCMAFANF